MFAIIETGGNQYRVSPKNTIEVEKLDNAEIGSTVTLNNVLFLQEENGNSLIGKPLLNNVKVEAKVINHFKDDKVIDFVKRRRKNSRRKNGHRQPRTKLEILNIIKE